MALGGNDSSGDPSSAMRASGCTFETYPNQGRRHFASPNQPFKYNSFPPTSGSHDPVPAVFNAYDDPVNERKLVHNLEHGGIAVQYGNGVAAGTIEQLRTFARGKPRGTVLAPYPKLGDKIALGVWTAPADDPDNGTAYLATCTAFDETAFEAFYDNFQFKGRERFPADSLLPGGP
jgi:hypothetical protein